MQIERGRVGQFFLFVGLILLVIFFATDQSQEPQVGWFFGGLLVMGVGVYLIWKDWKPRPPSQRFRLLRMYRKRKEGDENKRE